MENRKLGYSIDDYRNGVPPRAIGTETEYTDDSGVERLLSRYTTGIRAGLLPSHVNPRYFVSTARQGVQSVVTSNGGEMYLDSATLEYATPECTSPQEAVLHERIGEQIVVDTITRIALGRNPRLPTVYKRSGYVEVWSESRPTPLLKETSIGHHENYTSINNIMEGIYAAPITHPGFHCLSDFLVLRKLIDGAGMVADDHFSITQKPTAIKYRTFERDTTHGRKKAFQQKGDRLEVRSGEGSKSDWAAAFKLGLTSLVLRLIEHGKQPNHLKLSDPNAALLNLAQNPLGYVALESGIRMRGIDVLKNIVDCAYELVQQYDDTPAYEHQAYTDFLKFYDDIHKVSLKDDDVAALADRIDWAARYAFLVRQGATHRTITTDDLQQVRYDLIWDRIGDNDIARKWFSRFGHTAINVALAPPPHTRAETRVAIARDLYKNSKLGHVSWDRIFSRNGTMYTSDHPLDLRMEPRPQNILAAPNNDPDGV